MGGELSQTRVEEAGAAQLSRSLKAWLLLLFFCSVSFDLTHLG